MIKNKNRGGFIDRQRKEVGVGEEEKQTFFIFPSRALGDVVEKDEKKNKTTSVSLSVNLSVSESFSEPVRLLVSQSLSQTDFS